MALDTTVIVSGDCNGTKPDLKNLLRYRIFFTVLHFFIGLALLTNVSFISSWRPVQDSLSFSNTGIGPIDSTIALQNTQPNIFWFWFYGIVVSPNYSTSIAPTKCTEGLCYSCFLPGTMYSLNPTPSFPSEQGERHTALVINNVTGYQVEFYPPEPREEINGAVCQVYGAESNQVSVAVLICLKRSGNDLLAGFSFSHGARFTVALNACANRPACLTDTSWQNNITYYTKVKISQRQANVAYSSTNGTILDVASISDQNPTNYDPLRDFFPIYDMAMNLSNPAIPQYLTIIADQILNTNQYEAHQLLRQFILVPVGLYQAPSSSDKVAYIAIPTYQVRVTGVSLLKIDHHIIRLPLFVHCHDTLIVSMVTCPSRGIYAHSTSQFIILS